MSDPAAEELNYLDMSDEEVASMSLPNDPVEQDYSTDEQDSVDDSVSEEANLDEGETDEVDDEPPANSEASDNEDDDASEDEASSDTDSDDEAEGDSDQLDQEEKTESDEEIADAQAQLKKLFAPFKANGREMKIDNVDDAITLMQMGANFNKKMHAIKPHLKVVRMLENNQLLDEKKLSFLIDLDKRDPKAIAKLVKDSNIDPLDINAEEGAEYTPNSYSVDDTELAVTEALEAIRDTAGYETTLNVISDKWDDASKRTLAENPSVIGIINSHVESGIYDQIQAEVDKQRMLGRLTGMSDIAAYKAVGDQMFLKQEQQTQSAPTSQKPAIQPQRNKPANPEVNRKKRAASPTKGNTSQKGKAGDFNPLAQSDEEIEKMLSGKFL